MHTCQKGGRQYTVEIGYNRGSVWHVIARSVTIKTPADQMSPSEQFDYATIPLHLSFQKLIEGIQHALKSGDTLITALSRLQKRGQTLRVRLRRSHEPFFGPTSYSGSTFRT